MNKITHEDIKNFIENQIQTWPLAKKNLDALIQCKRRPFTAGDLHGVLQFNPARIVSTGAPSDPDSISRRPCFLCAHNRPKEQTSYKIEEGWDMLINPYPIFPVHLTIVNTQHTPQRQIPYEMISMAEKLEGMTVFYNGAKAGASAPDHLHVQAVLTEELPLMRLLAQHHSYQRKGIFSSYDLGIDLPYEVISAVIYPDSQGMEDIKTMMEDDNGGLVNIFCWIDYSGILRIARIERKNHRPSCYGQEEGQYLVSPGCIDMAGIIITPLLENFESLSNQDIWSIFQECGHSTTN
ncbi:MAG: DUF4922 domain-containing protein [Bacteroides sp.]|nr:DUF4922 domain-containing protein [Bacteroides sp.]